MCVWCVQEEEENRLKSVASQEISKLRAEAEREGEAKREEVMREIQRQLQVFREEQEDKHNKVGHFAVMYIMR